MRSEPPAVMDAAENAVSTLCIDRRKYDGVFCAKSLKPDVKIVNVKQNYQNLPICIDFPSVMCYNKSQKTNSTFGEN